MQKDPLIHQYRSTHVRPLFSLLAIISLFYILALLLTNLFNITTFLSLIPWQLVFFNILVFFSLYAIGIRSIWNKHTALRKRALSSDPTILAAPQPTPNPYYTLPLPTTITLQPDFKRVRTPILGGVIVLLIVIFLAFVFYSTLLPSSIYFPFFSLIVLITLPAFIRFISVLRKARSPLSQQRIEVTEQGLTVSYQGKVSRLAWQDALLFTVSDFNQKHLPLFYELSGKHRSLIWMQALPKKPLRLHQYLTPTIPFEEYTYQMQALHALITTRTELPLYNLSNPIKTTTPPTIMTPQ